MGGREADAFEAVDLLQRAQKARERLAARRLPRLVADAVAQDALAEEADLLHAARGEAAHLLDHLLRGTRILVAAHVRDDAVAAAVVAAEEDGDVALDPRERAGAPCVRMRVQPLRHLVVA